jgi:hypothetical protein
VTDDTAPKSESKAQVELLLAGFQTSFQAGDYFKARAIADELRTLAPSHPSMPSIRERATLLAVDPFVVRFGWGVAVLYLMGWALAKFTVS